MVFDSIQQRKGSIVVNISPLIALMKDQVATFLSKGVSAVRAGDCHISTSQKIMEGEYQLVFFSPEAILCRRKWRKMLLTEVYQEKLVGLLIDEAHCVKKW
jgi:ATP-dependent DNA helicase RecQ